MKKFYILALLLLSIISTAVMHSDDERILIEMVQIFSNDGQDSLKAYCQKNRDKISNDIIWALAQYGFEERNENILTIAFIAAVSKGDELLIANVGDKIGDYYFYIGNNNAAIQFYNHALLIYEANNEPLGQGNVWRSLGKISFREGENRKAEEYFRKALKFFELANEPIGQGNVWYALGMLYEKLEQKQKAYDSYLKSLSFIEYMRASARSIESKQSFFEQYSGRFPQAALFMLSNGYEKEGFKAIESMKARALLDMLAERHQGIEEGIPSNLLAKRDSLSSRISALQKLKIDLNGKKEKANLERIDSEIAQASIEYDKVISQIRIASPKAASILYPEAVNIDSLQAVLKSKEVVLEYILGDSSAFCIVIGKDMFKVVELKMPKGKSFNYKEFYDICIQDWLKKLWEYGRIPEDTRLYSILIGPMEEYIKGKDLIIIPDFILYYVPFEALTYREGAGYGYLIERHNILYYQSATLLSQSRRAKKSEQRGLIAFGDPVFDYENFNSGKMEYGDRTDCDAETLFAVKTIDQTTRDKLTRLKGSGFEVSEIGKIFKNNNQASEVYLRDRATKENVKRADLEKYGYIMFSTYGLVTPEFQGLAFSQLGDNREDSYLSTAEIMGLRYKAQLVVMSACQTGLGKLERGEGISGLTRAAMYAGADAVLASLWNVSDFGTAKFMIEFFDKLINKKMSKAEALRQTKLDFINNNDSYRCGNTTLYFTHPFFWSAFVMYGE